MSALAITTPDLTLDEKIDALLARLRALGPRVLVAFSGGVDSTVVMAAAHRALEAGALGVVAKSESNTTDDVALCEGLAAEHGFALRVIEYSELAIPNYASNPANRCYYCKSELYDRLTAVARAEGFGAVCDGTNADDGGDYRPGLKAVAERGVLSPLRDCGITKAEVRAIAKRWGLPNHDKPAAPCLSSRVPYGERITEDKLTQVALAEKYLRGLGVTGNLRCRHHGEVARIEVEPEAFPILLAHRDRLVREYRRLGFRWITLDLAGFASGGLNAVLSDDKPPTG
ncbi:MAG: ATP-dependent sacrificial sulfur transferase LarE [Sumerlaeia bacterium]